MIEKGIFRITNQDKLTVDSILAKIKTAKSPLAIISFPELSGLLNARENQFVDRVCHIDSEFYGAKLPFLGIEPLPKDLVAIENQKYLIEVDSELEEKAIPTQFLPERTFKAYQKLNKAIYEDLGSEVIVESGYRSPASQAATLTDFIQKFNYDLYKVLSLVAAVGHSEHGFPPHQAIDFATTTGVGEGGVDERFALTPHYPWLLENADKFGFVLSYPNGNPDGISFEPWHWSHRLAA